MLYPVERGARRAPRCSGRLAPVVVESFERRLLFAVDLMIGAGHPAQALTFTDADGTSAQVRVAGGSATISFDGTSVGQTTTGKLMTVTGTGVAMRSMLLLGDNPSVTVRTTGGDGTVALLGISAEKFVRAFSGRGVVLTGSSTLTGGIGRLELAGTQGAFLVIRTGQAPPAPQDTSITILNASGTSLAADQPIRLLRVGGWSAGTAGQTNSLIAPRISVLQCAGDFTPSLTLTGGQDTRRPVLGNVRVMGVLASPMFGAFGRIGRIAVGSVGSQWVGTLGDVGTFAVAGDLAGRFGANSINSLTAASITGVELHLDRPFVPGAPALNRLGVRGAITDTFIASGADIGTIAAGSMTRTTILAGVDPSNSGTDLPPGPGGFVNPATIRGVTLHGGAGANYSDSAIAATNLGRINLGAVHVDNAGRPFGVAADTIASVSGTRDDTGDPVRAARLTDPADGIDLGDFEVRVF